MTVQQIDINDSNPELCALICERIAASRQRRITFAEYMNLALYHPQHGYYNSDRPSIGKQGDLSRRLIGVLILPRFWQSSLWKCGKFSLAEPSKRIALSISRS